MRIVVGIDGSDASLTAFELVAGTAWPAHSTIRLVGAYEASIDWSGLLPPTGTASEDDAGRRLLAKLQAWSESLQSSGHATKVVVARGRAADVLLAEADALGADLIVVGSRGLGVAASAVIGSVSAALVDHAPCPVLVARGPAVTRILVATDGSVSAEAIPAVLLAWNVFRHAPIDVLCVAPPSAGDLPILAPEWLMGDTPHVNASHEVERQRVMAEEMAARFTAGGWHATGTVRRGDAARQIEAAADEWGADLIVTGSRGLGGLRRLLLGSVAHHVLLHSPRSVLVMRGHIPARHSRRSQAPHMVAAGNPQAIIGKPE